VLVYSSSLVDHEKDVRQGVLGYDEALAELRKARLCAKPNEGFEVTLRNFAAELREGCLGKGSASQTDGYDGVPESGGSTNRHKLVRSDFA
jgi:hypothetical protein